MSGREDVSNRYLASGFGTSGVESTLARMLGQDVPEKLQYCTQCGEPTSPGYSIEKDSANVYCKTHYEQLFASRCEGCNQPIVGQFFNSQGKKYHTQCAPESGRCERCRKPIIGEVVSMLNKTYHPKCFTCTSCDTVLGGTYTEIGSAPFCYKCGNDVNQARASGKPISGLVYESAADKEQREKARIQNQLYKNVQAGKDTCNWCRKVIVSDLVSFSGKTFHAECFTCTGCGNSIGHDTYTDKGGAPYCQTCAPKPSSTSSSSGAACAGCGQALSGQFVVALQLKYHSQCFKCSQCGNLLKGSFAEKAGKPVCPSCVSVKVTTAHDQAGGKQRGFVIDPRSGKKTFV